MMFLFLGPVCEGSHIRYSSISQGCRVEGALQLPAEQLAAVESAGAGNTLVAPPDPSACSLPAEGGAFVWTPDRFTRKQ